MEAEASSWTKRHFYQLAYEAEELESFLDDYGARCNRNYHGFTEQIASLRGFALAGFALQHLAGRADGYRVAEKMRSDQHDELAKETAEARLFICSCLTKLLAAAEKELAGLGLDPVSGTYPVESLESVEPRFRLPHNVGQEDLVDEEHHIAEVASKFLQANSMLEDLGVHRLETETERREFMAKHCSEEQARVYEATVHNLQSAYDTYIKNTVLEARDHRLVLLRGHVSMTLHLLEVATLLTHFIERHEGETRQHEGALGIAKLVDADDVRDVTLNILLAWAVRVMANGREIAEDLLPNYINLQELEVELSDDLMLHARPASLIVSIVNHYGTPVEMEVQDSSATCNAASILELMVIVGSNPDSRKFRFRGDAKPLRDIQLLFENDLGERGLDDLPPNLGYLRI
ncbi:MAG: phosphotransferase system HPr-like phosphotransfer protein [Planctomycetota bacterium]|jgi:phosphotransferase system HPr-like phosphotransfer protein